MALLHFRDSQPENKSNGGKWKKWRINKQNRQSVAKERHESNQRLVLGWSLAEGVKLEQHYFVNLIASGIITAKCLLKLAGDDSRVCNWTVPSKRISQL